MSYYSRRLQGVAWGREEGDHSACFQKNILQQNIICCSFARSWQMEMVRAVGMELKLTINVTIANSGGQ